MALCNHITPDTANCDDEDTRRFGIHFDHNNSRAHLVVKGPHPESQFYITQRSTDLHFEVHHVEQAGQGSGTKTSAEYKTYTGIGVTLYVHVDGYVFKVWGTQSTDDFAAHCSQVT